MTGKLENLIWFVAKIEGYSHNLHLLNMHNTKFAFFCSFMYVWEGNLIFWLATFLNWIELEICILFVAKLISHFASASAMTIIRVQCVHNTEHKMSLSLFWSFCGLFWYFFWDMCACQCFVVHEFNGISISKECFKYLIKSIADSVVIERTLELKWATNQCIHFAVQGKHYLYGV